MGPPPFLHADLRWRVKPAECAQSQKTRRDTDTSTRLLECARTGVKQNLSPATLSAEVWHAPWFNNAPKSSKRSACHSSARVFKGHDGIGSHESTGLGLQPNGRRCWRLSTTMLIWAVSFLHQDLLRQGFHACKAPRRKSTT